MTVGTPEAKGCGVGGRRPNVVAMGKSGVSRAQLFLFTVPAVLSMATVALAAAALWPVAVVTGLAALGAAYWGRRMLRNEQADEALREEQASGPDQHPGAADRTSA